MTTSYVGHLLVFAFLIVFLCGLWTVFAIWRQYRATGTELLKSLFLFLISFNILVFGCFVSRYAHTNLIGDDPFTYGPASRIATAVGIYILESSVAWTILRLAWNFIQKEFPHVLTMIYITATALIGSSYLVGFIVMIHGGSPLWIVRTHQAMSLFMVLVIGFALLVLIVGRHGNLDEKQRRSSRYFGLLILTGILMILVSLALPKSVYLVGFAVGLLWTGCSPLLWLQRYAEPYQERVTPELATPSIAVLAKRYGITQREQEIMALLVEGKSNKEIEDLLCISFSTVKNHVYNLYKKLEVTSRTQLIHLVIVESAHKER